MKSIFERPRVKMQIVLISSMICLTVNGQDGSKEDLDKRAMKNFHEENYEKAVPDFEILHGIYPKDARISYYYGRSCLQSNQNLEEAASLLKFSATRNYGEDAYFYLGKAYHLTYQFDEADIAFNTFKNTAKARYLKANNIDYWVEVNKNAKKTTNATLKTLVIKNIPVPLNALESAFSENINGKYIFVPDEFKSETDKLLNFKKY
jgi:tetratricopeptide (TPR) repeat protein